MGGEQFGKFNLRTGMKEIGDMHQVAACWHTASATAG